MVWQSLSEMYLARKEFDSSLKISLQLENSFRNSDDRVHLMTTLFDAGNAYDEMKNHKAALHYASEGLSLAEHADARQSMIDGYQLLLRIYSNIGRVDSAFSYMKKFASLRDSVLTKKFLSG